MHRRCHREKCGANFYTGLPNSSVLTGAGSLRGKRHSFSMQKEKNVEGKLQIEIGERRNPVRQGMD
jgi:hypothetical protein